MGRFGRCMVMHVMVKNNKLQTCWSHALIYIGLYRHLLNHTFDSYLPLDLYRSSFTMSNWQFGLKSWHFLKSLSWADIDTKWPPPLDAWRFQMFRSPPMRIAQNSPIEAPLFFILNTAVSLPCLFWNLVHLFEKNRSPPKPCLSPRGFY